MDKTPYSIILDRKFVTDFDRVKFELTGLASKSALVVKQCKIHESGFQRG